MDVEKGSERKTLVAAYEALGTSIFVYLIILSTGHFIAVPLALFAVILLFGAITGGHFNPAVTLGVYMW
jgi:glycerol uptake facilitator-like aquaporin